VTSSIQHKNQRTNYSLCPTFAVSVLYNVGPVSRHFWRVISQHPCFDPYQNYCLMRSCRRTTQQVAENSMVEDATDACSLQRISATFLANSSASLGRPYFWIVVAIAMWYNNVINVVVIATRERQRRRRRQLMGIFNDVVVSVDVTCEWICGGWDRGGEGGENGNS
jgi:hypothetical protein